MSADNGVYILETLTDDGYEYRVRHMQNVEDYAWDSDRGDFTDDPGVQIRNARERWANCQVFTKKGEALEYADSILSELDICEYGISTIRIPRKF